MTDIPITNLMSTAQSIPLDLLRCPVTHGKLVLGPEGLTTGDCTGHFEYRLDHSGIPLFAEVLCSRDASAQQAHYEKVAGPYLANQRYPHTQEYIRYLDEALFQIVDEATLETAAEICCGRAEAFQLLGAKMGRGVGVDVSISMLRAAQRELSGRPFSFVQGDATALPLADCAFDSVFMLGGIHHVNDRPRLFAEIARILKPGGKFYFREPVNDFALWRVLRAVIYRASPALDHVTERPLRYKDTVPLLEKAGLTCKHWQTLGFWGFCLFMNSDVLVLNRLFRYVPGIRHITRWSTRFDKWTVRLPGMNDAGLQVIGVAAKGGEGS